MEAPASISRGISHTCFGNNIVRYNEPVPAWMVRNTAKLTKEFGQKPVKQVNQINTFKNP